MGQNRKRDPTFYEERKKQAYRVYNYINDYTQEEGFCPSMREIADSCYMSRGSVTRYLDLLEAWGYISREPGLSRAITIIDPERRL